MTRVANNSAPGVTAKQIAYIWMLARNRGIADETLHDWMPKGSISQLTVWEAAVAIDAMKRGEVPDFSARPRGYHKKTARKARPPRLPKGSGRRPTLDQLILNENLTNWIADHWGWSLKKLEAWLATKHYDHGGPMNVIISSGDCVERIELLKALKWKTIRRDRKAEGAAREQKPQRQRSAEQGVLFG